MTTAVQSQTVGWIGAGRMGYALAERLVNAGADLSIYNRTRSKVEGLGELGAKIVDRPSELADRDIVFTMVGGPGDVLEVTLGPDGVLSDPDSSPSVLVDSTTIDAATSAVLTEEAAKRDTAVLAAPVSGNPKVVRAGKLTVVSSGPKEAHDKAQPFLEEFGRTVTYVGEGDVARLVKIAHNMMLGVVAQNLAEITLLVEAAGVKRSDFLGFLNDSVMGSAFTRYKTPALVNLDYAPTFTWHLLRKDLELGLDAGREFDIALPTTSAAHQLVVQGIGLGYGDQDFAALLSLAAATSGRTIGPEGIPVSDGLS